MAGTSNKTTVVGVRVPNDTLAEWQSVIGDRSMAAYVLERAMRPDKPERVAELLAQVAACHEDIARLKRDLATERQKPKPSIDHGTVRTADLSSPKAVAAALPVTGDRFPKQLTWWQKKELAGSKGKAK